MKFSFFPTNSNDKLFYPPVISIYRIFFTEEKSNFCLSCLNKTEKPGTVKRLEYRAAASASHSLMAEGGARQQSKARIRVSLADDLDTL